MKPHPDPIETDDEVAALWAARLEGSELSAQDRASLDAWLSGVPGRRALLSSYCQFSADLEQQLPLIEGIRNHSAELRSVSQAAQSYSWLRWPTMAGVALTAAAAVTVIVWLNRPATQTGDFATPMASRQSVELADGTQIQLSAQTALHVEFGTESRRVRLASGEAFFSVKSDPARAFIVETPGGSIRVTGTQFNVRADSASTLEVTVVEGSVQASPSAQADGPVRLKAGEQLRSNAQAVEHRVLSEDMIKDLLAWRSGHIVFDGTPLGEALARFARYHGRGITASPAVESLAVGGRFSLDDLEGFFAALEEVQPVQVTRNSNGTITVTARPAIR